MLCVELNKIQIIFPTNHKKTLNVCRTELKENGAFNLPSIECTVSKATILGIEGST